MLPTHFSHASLHIYINSNINFIIIDLRLPFYACSYFDIDTLHKCKVIYLVLDQHQALFP